MTRYYEEIRNHYKRHYKSHGHRDVAVYQWATQSDWQVPCDGCGIKDSVKAQNVLNEYIIGYGVWVHVLCVKCYDNYSG